MDQDKKWQPIQVQILSKRGIPYPIPGASLAALLAEAMNKLGLGPGEVSFIPKHEPHPKDAAEKGSAEQVFVFGMAFRPETNAWATSVTYGDKE